MECHFDRVHTDRFIVKSDGDDIAIVGREDEDHNWQLVELLCELEDEDVYIIAQVLCTLNDTEIEIDGVSFG